MNYIQYKKSRQVSFKMYLKLNRIFIIFLIAISAKAQIRYETLDSLSSSISEMEKQVEGKEYKEDDGEVYRLSFPWENFKVYFYNKLATKAEYQETNGTETLLLTEDIDFSKATGLTVSKDYNKVAYIKVDFPSGHIKTQVFENGNLVGTVNRTSLEFYSQYGAVDKNRKFYFDKMYDELYALCTKLKIDKSLMTESDVRNESADWIKMTAENFIKKHPKSLLAAQAHQNIKDQEEEKLKKQQ